MARRLDGASPERRPGPARILDVAEVASVSVATVSRVLNGDARVDQALRERVLAAASQLGYRPNRLARNLRRQQMDAIGIVVPDIENPHFAATVRIVEAVALGLGHRVLVCNTDEDGDRQTACLQMLADERVSGIVLSPSDPEGSIGHLRDLAIPVVTIDRTLNDGASDAVLADNLTAVRAGTRRLIDAGHTSIACVGGRSDVDTGSERQRGYLAAIGEAWPHPGTSRRPVPARRCRGSRQRIAAREAPGERARCGKQSDGTRRHPRRPPSRSADSGRYRRYRCRRPAVGRASRSPAYRARPADPCHGDTRRGIPRPAAGRRSVPGRP